MSGYSAEICYQCTNGWAVVNLDGIQIEQLGIHDQSKDYIIIGALFLAFIIVIICGIISLKYISKKKMKT